MLDKNKKMREVSPVLGVDVEEYLEKYANDEQKAFAIKFRTLKNEGNRYKPSTQLIDKSEIKTPEFRAWLLDEIATLVDENLFGRSEMCLQFAELLTMALKYLYIDARMVLGKAIYYNGIKESFRWDHAWVRINYEIIDGNLDSIIENPRVPKSIRVAPYWGNIKEMPLDRRLQENRNIIYKSDVDVAKIWWPDLVKSIERYNS
jgi:hypothetical protein